jgi:hypothetical protein
MNPATDLYYWMLDCLHGMNEDRGSFHMISEGHNTDGEQVVDYQELWVRMRSAKLFSVPTVLMMDTYDEVSDYVSDLVNLGEEDQIDPKLGTPKLFETGMNQPYPERLPFDHLLLLYPWAGRTSTGKPVDPSHDAMGAVTGAGILLTDDELGLRFGPDAVSRLRRYGSWAVLGHLLSHDGWVWEILRWTMFRVEGTTHVIDPNNFDESVQNLHPDTHIEVATGFAATVTRHGEKDQWWSPLSMNPWALPSVVYMINDYKTLVLQKPSASDRMHAKRWGKKRGFKRFRPPMYYGIMLTDNVVFTRAVATQFPERQRSSQEFRSDVRGHERCRIRRGPSPMGTVDRIRFEERGYTIYEATMDLDPEDEKRLRERGQPLKERGEWIAIKTSWVDSYLKGPEDGPYIPANRHLPIQPPVSWGGGE